MPHLTNDLLKKLLDDLGRGSQRELAKHMGLNPEKISRMTTGGRQIQSAEIPSIVEFFRRRGVWPSDGEDSAGGHLLGSADSSVATVLILPPPQQSGRVDVQPIAPHHPQIVRAEGSFCPKMEKGEFGIIEPGEQIRPGDLVFGWRERGHAIAAHVVTALGEEIEVTTCGGGNRETWLRSEFLHVYPVTWSGRTLFPFVALSSGKAKVSAQDAAREFIKNLKIEANEEGRSIGPLELVERALSHIRGIENES